MLEKIASDLGLYRFQEESSDEYKIRVVYSSLSCWIKAATLDSVNEKKKTGVSKKHVLKKASDVLRGFISLYPEINSYFYGNEDIDPVSLLRERLILGGDILTCGFNTDIIMSDECDLYISNVLQVLYGRLIEKEAFYSGVSVLKRVDNNEKISPAEDIMSWFKNYVKTAWWKSIDASFLESKIEIYDVAKKINNNYGCWQTNIESIPSEVMLGRRVVNKSSYEYFLLKKDKMHRIDPFMVGQGEHIRMMLALRLMKKNYLVVRIKIHSDCVCCNLPILLPNREKKLFQLYAWPLDKIENEYNWIMEKDIWNIIEPSIRNLGLNTKGEM